MSKVKTVLAACNHCNEKQNLEILAESHKLVDWFEKEYEGKSVHELEEIGPGPTTEFT